MNLIDLLLAESRAMPEVMTRDQVQKKIWELTRKTGREREVDPEDWKQEWIPSEHFVLMDVPVNQIDQPIKPHYPKLVKRKMVHKETEPIFIDRNRHRYGKHRRLRMTDTYVVDGKHRAEAARNTNQKTMKAYVGDQAIPHFQSGRPGRWWSDPELKKLQ